MITSFLKIAARKLKSNPLFTTLNVLGLSVSIAFSLVLLMYLSEELNFDRSTPRYGNIFRVLDHLKLDDKQVTWGCSPNAASPAIAAQIPQVAYSARVVRHNFGGKAFLKIGNQSFAENNLYYCDPDFLDIFSVGLVEGDKTAFPHGCIISESTAKRLCKGDPLGQVIIVEKTKHLQITGVYKDFPENASFDADIIAPYAASPFATSTSWSNLSFETYVYLKDPKTSGSVERSLTQIAKAHAESWPGFSLEGMTLQPFADVHLHSSGVENTFIRRLGNLKELTTISFLAFLILLIACINYMNLSTAQYFRKIKEVGISRVLGASGKHLALLFYLETSLMILVSLLIGACLSLFLVPLFNQISGKNMHLGEVLDARLGLEIAGLWILVTLLAGSYPSLLLARSRFYPGIRQALLPAKGQALTRRILIVLQFSASLVLISLVSLIFRQFQFIKNQDLGYNPNNVIAIDCEGVNSHEQIASVINDLRSLHNVTGVCRLQGFPGAGVSGREIKKRSTDKEGAPISTNATEGGFLDVLQLHLLAGRMLTPQKNAQDTVEQVVVNKKTCDFLGLSPADAIGKSVDMQLGPANIVGVVNDFNDASLESPIGLYAFHNGLGDPGVYIMVRFQTGENLPATIAEFQKLFQKNTEGAAFSYTFMDQFLESLYAEERNNFRIILSFSLLALFISTLGLIGLAAFTVEQRTKEIAIRKILGSSLSRIYWLLSGDFYRLTFLSIAISVPVAWILAEKWLANFAYRTNISPLIFVLAAMLIFVLTTAIIGFHTYKLSKANPVKAIRMD